jgi:hypothetical protein
MAYSDLRPSGGGSFSSAAGTTTPTLKRKPIIAPAIPQAPSANYSAGYGSISTPPTFSAAAPPVPAVVPTTFTYSDAALEPPLPTQPKPVFHAPVNIETYPQRTYIFPFVYNLSIKNEYNGGQPPGGVNGEVQYNEDGTFAGDAGLLFDPTTNNLTIGGNTRTTGLITDNLFYSNGNPWVIGTSSYGDANVAAYLPTYTGSLSGHLTTNAQPNVTSVGTLSALSVTANVAAGGIKTDNLFYSNGNPWVFASAYGDANVASYLPTYTGLLAGTLSTNAQPNVTSVGTLTTLNVSANTATGGILTDNIYWANGVLRVFGSGGGSTLNITPNVFRGTNAQTVYTLTVDPGGINYTQIFIFGVYQQKATYSVVGTTLTFSSAPPAPPQVGDPDNIEVLIYRLI